MADRFPLIVDSSTNEIKEPPSGDNLDLTGCNIINATTITGTDINSSSDINLKKNISKIKNPLDKLSNINGVSFEWKYNDKKSIGVIAQEVESVLPELISRDKENILNLNYNGLIALLIESVNELKKEIEELKSNK